MNTEKQYCQPTLEQVDRAIQRCEDSGWCEPQSYEEFMVELCRDYINAIEFSKKKHH